MTAVLFGLSAFTANAAHAVLTDKAQAVKAGGQITSGSWGAVATMATTGPYPTVPFTIAVPAGTPIGSFAFLSIVNTGNLALSQVTYSLAASAGAVVALETCTGTWNEAANTCPGTIQTVVSSLTSPVTSSTVAIAPGAALRVRGRLVTLPGPGTNVTLAVAVSRTGARPATTASS